MEGHYEYSDDFEEESDGTTEAPKPLDPLITPIRGRVVRTKGKNTHRKRKTELAYSISSPGPPNSYDTTNRVVETGPNFYCATFITIHEC